MQWRVLVVVSAQPQGTLGAVASALGVHPSTATRLVDQLVTSELLLRREHPTDRRYLSLSLSRKGERLVEKVTTARRRDIEVVLERIDVSRRHLIAVALDEFALASGEISVSPRGEHPSVSIA
jgi:DNA-binding MarR family transcriptional regulator